MNFFDLDPRKLPTTTLYRVQYDGCMTIYNPPSGLSARDNQTVYDRERDDMFTDFGGAVEDHLCWRKNRRSPFISLFANKRHAENWALDWSERHQGRLCDVFEINAPELVGSYVFHAYELWESLCLQVPAKAEASIPNEYLVTHGIPRRAIVGRRNTEDIRRGECCSLQEINEERGVGITDRPTEHEAWGWIIPVMPPHPKDVASQELIDDLKELCI